MVEEAPVKQSKSNGLVERAVQDIEGGVRAMFIALQERLGLKMQAKERIVAFIPEYVAYLMNRLMVGADGKSVYERLKGKAPSVLGVEFGEKVMYKKRRGAKFEKINPRLARGYL